MNRFPIFQLFEIVRILDKPTFVVAVNETIDLAIHNEVISTLVSFFCKNAVLLIPAIVKRANLGIGARKRNEPRNVAWLLVAG